MTKKISFLKETPKLNGDITFSYELELPDDKEIIGLNTKITYDIYEALKQKIDKEILVLLSYPNFYGEAEEYMARNSIPYSKDTRILYAKAILKEFSENILKLIEYNTENNEIWISPYIYDLEFGTYYRPAVGFISKVILKYIEEIVTLK